MSVKKIVILGSGVAGSALAASLSQALLKTDIDIYLIEIDEDSDSSHPENKYAAECLSPHSQIFHETLGIDEAEILAYAHGTFCFGTHFTGWVNSDSGFLQTYGSYGVDFDSIDFHHFYAKYKEPLQLSNYDHYSLSAAAAEKGRFSHPVNDNTSILSTLSYGLNLNSFSYAEFLKNHARRNSAKVIKGQYVEARLNEEGAVEAIVLTDEVITGDFFIDCSGHRALLLGQALGINYIDWSEYFRCNRYVSFASEQASTIPSAISIAAGDRYWIKSIPLQDFSANTLMFNEKYLSEDEARVITNADHTLVEPLMPGHRQSLWYKNVIAFGSAAVNLEPFTFAGMDVLYRTIQAFLNLLPRDSNSPLKARQYNRIAIETYERLRDYHLAHYVLTRRQPTSNFWQDCQSIALPDTVEQQLALFYKRGKFAHENEWIPKAMWASLYIGFGLLPERYDPFIDRLSERELQEKIHRIKKIIAQTVTKMPVHADYLEHYLHSKRATKR